MIRILIADDEPSIRLVLRDALEGAGHEVVEAADAAGISMVFTHRRHFKH